MRANQNRRGFIRPTKNGHALEYADGTTFFILTIGVLPDELDIEDLDSLDY